MHAASLDLLTKKLKNAPQSVLERVIGYVDALVEPSSISKSQALTTEQQQILDSQLNADKSNYTPAELIYADLKNKHEL
ncbi:MAG: hypothetical protein CFE24_10035 [Flavobacterium sp. BFFFF2]|nr:MAG: hypothetical protein CFE24_10035 [Flavobacterium sp. BFFFF2]